MKLIVAALLPLVAGLSFAEEVPQVLSIGSDLPSFSLPGIDGKTHSEKDYAEAKVLCLVFTCNHCPDAVPLRAAILQGLESRRGKPPLFPLQNQVGSSVLASCARSASVC